MSRKGNNPLGRIVRAGVSRKRVQTLVMTLTTMTAVTASVLASGLLVDSQGPYQRAFAAEHGAHLSVDVSGTAVDAGQLAATAHVAGVTGTAGPYPTLTLHPRVAPGNRFMPAGDPMEATTVVGRPIDGPLDDLHVTEGHWLTGPGQIVLPDGHSPMAIGDRMVVPDAPGHPVLTVVGLAASVTGTADGWVAPQEIPALTPPGTVPDEQMLYRFAHADSQAEVAADRAAVAAVLPAGATLGSTSYLDAEQEADRNSATFVPFLVAFGALGLFMSLLVIGVVVSGAVTAGRRRIGILKAIGFSPAQVVRAYLGQALIPATTGAVLGVVLGNLLSIPVMGIADKALRSVTLGIPFWLDLAVPLVTLAAVTGAALVPARRAGGLRTVEALAVGRTEQAGRFGRSAHSRASRLPLPRWATLGLALPFGRPARSAITMAAVLLGTVGVTFGVGLALSLNQVAQGLSHDRPGAVQVLPFPPLGSGVKARLVNAADLDAAGSAIAAQPGTAGSVEITTARTAVAGKPGQTQVIGYRGDSGWASMQIVSGRWFAAPGEAVAPKAFLSAYDVHVGDTVTLSENGRSAPVKLVGEVLSVDNELLTDAGSLTPLALPLVPDSVTFAIELKPGTDPDAYISSLTHALAPYGLSAIPSGGNINITVLAMDSLATILTLMLVTVAGLGVLNTVLLDTRERVHDLGVLKSLGLKPRQTVGMVLASVSVTGLVAGAVGVPIGILLQRTVLPAMAGAAGTEVPGADLDVFHAPLLLALLAGGLVLATLGALAPATWAARARTATALRTE
ncbi:ABC transporter permease [Streptacidiphilus jiangxiensis]|uniref:Putative ABC transport system permease protein n=1 Tax=Streptacidiphilus jiangxiensis TaxID=235985 RepID=A0A1H7U3K3_STRJI|nr:FtsX-like permease family protein [Streptacidiphilus jiangxiensis]SEL91404.1 putative ABC transport system permease protein [Streptacidiphilus jiangxiensis]